MQFREVNTNKIQKCMLYEKNYCKLLSDQWLNGPGRLLFFDAKIPYDPISSDIHWWDEMRQSREGRKEKRKEKICKYKNSVFYVDINQTNICL